MKKNRPLRIVDLTDEPKYEHLVEKAVVIPTQLLEDSASNNFEFKLHGLNCLFKVSMSRCCYNGDNHSELVICLTHDTQEERDTSWLLDSIWQMGEKSIKEYQEYQNGAWHNVEKH